MRSIRCTARLLATRVPRTPSATRRSNRSNNHSRRRAATKPNRPAAAATARRRLLRARIKYRAHPARGKVTTPPSTRVPPARAQAYPPAGTRSRDRDEASLATTVRLKIIHNARIKTVGQSESCMVLTTLCLAVWQLRALPPPSACGRALARRQGHRWRVPGEQ